MSQSASNTVSILVANQTVQTTFTKKRLLNKSKIKSKKIVTGFLMRLHQMRLVSHIFYLAIKRSNSFVRATKLLINILSLKHVNTGDIPLRKYIKLGRLYGWTMYAPFYPSEQFDRLINQELDFEMTANSVSNPLHLIFLSITKKCPLQCQHCFEWDIMHAEEKLSLGQLKGIVSKFQEQNISSVFLTGGEPLSRYKDLVELVAYASQQCKVWVFTSGYSLSMERAAELKSAGLTGVLVSVDHFIEEKHNEFRGNTKSFKNALNAVKNAQQVGLLTAISVCVTRAFLSKRNLESYMEFAKDLNVSFVQFFEPKKEGRYKEQDVLLDANQIEILEKFYRTFNEDRRNKHYPIIIYQGYHQRKIGCHGGGKRYLYINSNGDIQSCPFCAFKMGSALDTTFDPKLGKCMNFENVSNQIFES